MEKDELPPAPSESGWYRYSDGDKNTIFLKTPRYGWKAISKDGEITRTNWATIAEAGAVELIMATS